MGWVVKGRGRGSSAAGEPAATGRGEKRKLESFPSKRRTNLWLSHVTARRRAVKDSLQADR